MRLMCSYRAGCGIMSSLDAWPTGYRRLRDAPTEAVTTMIDFPITDLLDDTICTIWLERHLHPDGLKCPHCGSPDRRLFRQQRHFPAYRCRACDGYYTLLTGTAFEKTRQPPATLVLLLRGVAKGE